MLIKDMMTKNVVTVSPDSSLKEAGEIIKEKRISGVPVVDSNGNIVGIITLSDLLRVLDRIYRMRELEKRNDMGLKVSDIYDKQKSEAKVKDIMSKQVLTLNEDGDIHDVMKIMFGKGVHTLPVVKDGKLVGIIGKRDMIAAFF